MRNNRSRCKSRTKKRRYAGAQHKPYDKDGNLNKIWVKEYGNSHATFVVDPQGTGSYCHVTIQYRNDTTKYHYGFEVRNNQHRARGKHYWTTPYRDDRKFTQEIKDELARLFSELCETEEEFTRSSIRRFSDRRSTRSRSRSRSRRGRSNLSYRGRGSARGNKSRKMRKSRKYKR